MKEKSTLTLHWLKLFHPSVAFHTETSHLICCANLYEMQHWVELG